MSGDPNYCSICCNCAAKAGREVRMTDVYQYPICTLCESRMRNGYVYYRPSNGTEFRMFESRCHDCRHFIDDYEDPQPPKFDAPGHQCKWAVLDHLIAGSMGADEDSMAFWFNPMDLKPECPADCLRFTDKRDPNGEHRDPPPPDCIGQMTFSDVLVVEERVLAEARR